MGAGDCRAMLDDKTPEGWLQATYELEVAYTISADAANQNLPAAMPLVYGGLAGLDAIRIVIDLQVNPGGLPALSSGKNVIRYIDESGAGRVVKITYCWRGRIEKN